MIKFVIQGEPVAKGRPKFARRGNFTVAYTPEKTANYETLVKWAYQLSHHGESPLEGALHVNIKAVFGIPVSTSKKKRVQMLNGDIYPTKKPDADNIAKAVTDALNGLAYKDDSQIVNLSVYKRYGDTPQVEVTIGRMQDA